MLTKCEFPPPPPTTPSLLKNLQAEQYMLSCLHDFHMIGTPSRVLNNGMTAGKA